MQHTKIGREKRQVLSGNLIYQDYLDVIGNFTIPLVNAPALLLQSTGRFFIFQCRSAVLFSAVRYIRYMNSVIQVDMDLEFEMQLVDILVVVKIRFY